MMTPRVEARLTVERLDARSPLADLAAAVGVSVWTLIVALLVVGATFEPIGRAFFFPPCGGMVGRVLSPITHGVTWGALLAGVLGMVAGVRVMKRRRAVGFFAFATNASLLFALYITTVQVIVIR